MAKGDGVYIWTKKRIFGYQSKDRTPRMNSKAVSISFKGGSDSMRLKATLCDLRRF